MITDLFSKIHDNDWMCLIEAMYITLVTTMNRVVPVPIAIYRYISVKFPTYFMVEHNRKAVQHSLFGYMAGCFLFNYPIY